MFLKRAMTSILLIAALCFTAIAQQSPAPKAKPASESKATPEPPGVAVNPASAGEGSNLVVLRVSGEPITEKQVMAAMGTLAKQVVARPNQQDKRNEMLFSGAIDNLTVMTLLRAEARRRQLAVDMAKVDQQYEMISKQPDFQKLFAGRTPDEAAVRRSIEDSLSAQEILDSVTKNLPEPSDAEIQKMYDANSFAVPERAHIAQIFLKTEPGNTPEQKAEIRKKLEGIRSDVEAKKIPFAEAADKYSQDPGGNPKGGEIGTVSRSQVSIKALEEAIFSTPAGSLTPVVESSQGFHLVNVIEIKPAGRLSLEETKPMILQRLKTVAKQTATRRYVEDLKSKATIETFMTAEEFEKRHPSN